MVLVDDHYDFVVAVGAFVFDGGGDGCVSGVLYVKVWCYEAEVS